MFMHTVNLQTHFLSKGLTAFFTQVTSFPGWNSHVDILVVLFHLEFGGKNQLAFGAFKGTTQPTVIILHPCLPQQAPLPCTAAFLNLKQAILGYI